MAYTQIKHLDISRHEWYVTDSRYLTAAAIIAGLIIVTFVVATALGVEVPSSLLPPYQPTLAAVVASTAVLVVDTVIPVPSSLVCAGLGVAFGVVAGGLIAAAGLFCGSMVGFSVGRVGRRRFGGEPQSAATATKFGDHSGLLLLICTRPIPVAAETAVIVAGVSPMRWRTAIVGSTVGALLTGLAFAGVGEGAVRLLS